MQQQVYRMYRAMHEAGAAANSAGEAIDGLVEAIGSETDNCRAAFERFGGDGEELFAEYRALRDANPEWGFLDALAEMESLRDG